MTRIYNKEPSLCLWFFWQLQAFYLIYLAIFVSKFSYWFKIVNPCFVTSKIVYKLSLIEFGKHFEQLLRSLYLCPPPLFFCSTVNVCSIHLAEIVRTFKIRFKMQCTCNSNMPTGLAISRILYLPSLSIISLILETFALPVTVTGWPDFAAS